MALTSLSAPPHFFLPVPEHTGTGTSLSSAEDPLPSVPYSFQPHASTVPFPSSARPPAPSAAIELTPLRPVTVTGVGLCSSKAALPSPRAPSRPLAPQAWTVPFLSSA